MNLSSGIFLKLEIKFGKSENWNFEKKNCLKMETLRIKS